MIRKTLASLAILSSSVVAFAQTRPYESPGKTMRAFIVPVGAESRVEIRSDSGGLPRRRNFVSTDQNHGECVDHANGLLMGGSLSSRQVALAVNQPWHVATYFYSVSRNRFYSLDVLVGAIVSDFTLRGDTVVTARMGLNLDDRKPLTVSLNRWR